MIKRVALAQRGVRPTIPIINTAASIPSGPMSGSQITAIDATWNNGVNSIAYQWKAAGTNGTGAGATTLIYTPVVGDVGKTLTITVTATNAWGNSAPSTSAVSTAVVAASADVLALALKVAVCSMPIAA